MLPKNEINSGVSIDYSRLENLLTSGKWREANQETKVVMLKASGREKKGWLRVEDIENIPWQDFRTVDELWLKYSDGSFGFSVQTRIWESVGGTENANYQTYCCFGDRVGWRVNGSWLNYSDINYSLNAAPGHLPSVYPAASWGWLGRLLCRWLVSSLALKISESNNSVSYNQ